MIHESLNLYWIDMKYIRNLCNNVDKRVYSVSPQLGKQERPYLGVIILCNHQKYCIPLSKPKQKHLHMRDSIDFKKIIYKGELIGVLNFCSMIPVEDAQIHKIDVTIRKHDNEGVRKKKSILMKELEWCREHERDLNNTARVLYQKYLSGDNFSARKQCLDFIKMEKECQKYNRKKLTRRIKHETK